MNAKGNHLEATRLKPVTDQAWAAMVSQAQQTLAAIDNALGSSEELVEAIAQLLHDSEAWEPNVITKLRKAKGRHHMPMPPSTRDLDNMERYLKLRAALYDNVIDACEHVGTTTKNWPALCYRHADEGVLCQRCLVEHTLAYHELADLPAMTCDAPSCNNKLAPHDPTHDLDAWLAWARRSVEWALTNSEVVTAVNPAGDHVSYQGTTLIAFEHMLCPTCLARLQSATQPPPMPQQPPDSETF